VAANLQFKPENVLHFQISQTYCDILGFLGGVAYVKFPWPNNVNVAATIDSAKLLQFRSNATMKTNASSQQWKQNGNKGTDVTMKRE
jgi:hypothetical protein